MSKAVESPVHNFQYQTVGGPGLDMNVAYCRCSAL